MYDFATGNVKKKTDIYGFETECIYDKFGRLKNELLPTGEVINHARVWTTSNDAIYKQTITENASNKTTITKHNFVPSGNGVGKLDSIGLYEQGVLKHLQKFVYNNKHQLTSVTDSYDGQTVTFSNTYDDLWRPLTITSPSGLTTTNQYNNYGDLEKILSGNTVIWQGNEQNSKGQFTNYTLGNGLVTKRTFSDRGELESILTGFPISSTFIQNNSYTYYAQSGNLHTRTDLKNSRSELFEYDALDRLTKAYLNNELIHNMSYYPNGNIDTKSDVGTYRYDTPRPHAISGIDNVGAGITNQKQFIEYTAFNKVSRIKQGVDEQTINRVYDLFYGLDEQRIKTVYDDFSISGHVKTRYYFGTYEKETDEFGNITETDYLYTPAGLTAMQRKTSSGAGLYYIHTDLLGSIERITNATGQLVSEYTYTPWGGRILLSGVNITDRGYTGHEHLSPFGDDSNGGFCLINMNGRIYDPVLARFLSPDPYVQAPDFTQSFNRYAYGWNNPFKFTDPSGNSIVAAILIGGGINLVTQILAGNVSSVQDAFLAFGIGGLSGLTGAGIGQVVSSAISFGGFAAGALSGAAGGAAGGFIGGAGNAWFTGASLNEGLIQGLNGAGIGSISGGLIGGLSRGLSDLKNGFNFWDGSRTYEYSLGSLSTGQAVSNMTNYDASVRVSNDESLQSRIFENYGYKKGDLNLTQITTSAHIKNYGMTSTGDFVSLKSKELIGGYVRLYSSGAQSLHISPRIAFGDIVDFKAVVGHELIHAYHNFYIPNNLISFSERVAYKYTYDVYMNNGRLESAYSSFSISFQKDFWGTYPSNYQIPFFKFSPF